MNLRLYKTPFFDPIYPDIRRFLFEGKILNEQETRPLDFYLYVWLNMDGYLQAFQAVMEDTITVAYQMPDRLTYGKVSRDILNRGATQRETSEERRKLIVVIEKMTSGEFPSLFGSIREIVKGEQIPEIQLSKEEQKIFITLCSKNG